jgi:hypothetical protein
MNTVKTGSTKIERARKAFFNKLPAKIHCDRCDKTRAKEKFGVRLMNGPDIEKDATVKPRFQKQPFCNTCRH